MKPIASKTSNYSMKELKRCSKSFEAIQQAVVLTILNVNGFGFRIKRPERRSQKTLQLMLVEALIKDNSVIQFEHEVDLKCNQLVAKELIECGYKDLHPDDIDSISSIPSVSEKYDVEKLKQVKRHRDANRSALSFAELLQMCEKLGYNFKRRSTKPAKLTVKMFKICSISGKVSLGLLEINEIGKAVNENVFERFDKSSTSVDVEANDETISTIWKNATEKVVNRQSVVSEPMPNVKEEQFVIPEPSLGAMSNLTDLSSYYHEGSFISVPSQDLCSLQGNNCYTTIPMDPNQRVVIQPATMQQPMFYYNEEDGQTYISTEPVQYNMQPNNLQFNPNMVNTLMEQQPQQPQQQFVFTMYNQNSNQMFGTDDCFINQSLPPNGYY